MILNSLADPFRTFMGSAGKKTHLHFFTGDRFFFEKLLVFYFA